MHTPLKPAWRANRRKLAATLLVIAALAGIAGVTFSSYTDTTANGPNTFETGTVKLTTDAPSGSALFTLPNMRLGETISRCIRVINTGTLPVADVQLYQQPGGGGLAPYLHLTVTRGSGDTTFGDCSNFAPANQLYDGTMADMPAVSAPIDTADAGLEPGAADVYQFNVTLDSSADNAVEGATLNDQYFTWKATDASSATNGGGSTSAASPGGTSVINQGGSVSSPVDLSSASPDDVAAACFGKAIEQCAPALTDATNHNAPVIFIAGSGQSYDNTSSYAEALMSNGATSTNSTASVAVGQPVGPDGSVALIGCTYEQNFANTWSCTLYVTGIASSYEDVWDGSSTSADYVHAHPSQPGDSWGDPYTGPGA